ncbi:MAG: alpha/beta hydrolase [Dehalococcoidia bacterium]
MVTFESSIGRYLQLEIDGVRYRVYLEMAGEGVPVLLQHTAGSDNRQWRHLLDDAELCRQFRFIAADLPGHGKSLPADEAPWWDRDYRLTREFFMKFQVRLAEALELERPVFIGCSIGGHLAADLALDYPGVFRACIGLQGSLHTPSGEGTLDMLDNPLVGNQYAGALMYGLTSPESPEARRREVAWIYSQAAPGVFRGDLHYYTVEHDLRERAREIDTSRTPLYIMSGTYDWSSTTENSRALAELIPGCRFIEMPGLGHFPMAEDPVRFREYLAPVLAEVLGRG